MRAQRTKILSNVGLTFGTTMSAQSNSFNSGERETVIASAVLNLLEHEPNTLV